MTDYKEYTVRVWPNGDECWYKVDKLHREDGPAVIWASGDKQWWLNGMLHRENGPATEYTNGRKEWWLNGMLHRVDGPAVELSDGHKEWWINGVIYSEKEFIKIIKGMVSYYNSKIVEIEGKKYRLVEEKE